MTNDVMSYVKIIVSFLPFIAFAFLSSKFNTKKEVRNRQYPMPILAVVYSAALLIFLDKISTFLTEKFVLLAGVFSRIRLPIVGNYIIKMYTSWGIYLELILFNTAALVAFVLVKRMLTAIFAQADVKADTFIGRVVELFYSYDPEEEKWYIKEQYGQARTFIKTVYYATCVVSGIALLVSCNLCMRHLISAPFYPAFAVIIIGEMAFFIDGVEKEEEQSDLSVQADKSTRIAMYPFLRKPLRALFGDKLSAEGTTVNNSVVKGGAVEDVLAHLKKEGGHIGNNYATFIRRKMEGGLKPNVDYVRSGYELAVGNSLLFNTPFYDKLNPYVFYAMHRQLLTGGKILIVLGRHGTEEDLYQWCEKGMREVSNIPGLWKIAVLNGKETDEEELPDIGIISRSGVHDLDIHKNNLPFLRKVTFVVAVEPSRLVTTAQIGLNLLIRNCGTDRKLTFCSVDRNCDGLVDALSHILMTSITEVSATEYPPGMSSYMYWTADSDYLQHRIVPGVSRYLGLGTELSMVALKNQVPRAIWYGGETFPVKDAHWIAKQYYYDLLSYAQLPTNQETFDNCFQTSFNMCNERVSDYSYITVEDDRNNLFETRRNFATIAEEQGFVNVISSEYMLREYMSENTEMFTADAKAIPYITADYARTTRNAILSLCLLLCIDSVQEAVLKRQMVMLNVETNDPVSVIWREVCTIFSNEANPELDKEGRPILDLKSKEGKALRFLQDETILFKRAYSVDTGKFESIYTIENADFARIILDDLQNASYIAEQESKDVYIGTELKGHVYQKYMPGQFFTLNGKYYEMVSTATDNRILVRRASEYIDGRLAYRQVRNYTIHHLEDSQTMGALKTVNNIDIHYQFADFSVETPGYWKLGAHNDFDDGALVQVNGVPVREYHHKQILKFDFSKFGDAFTDSVRMTLTNLMNEVFVTLFAENQPFISAITPGQFEAPITYNLAMDEGIEASDKCIYIIEDSQLDIGLLIAVERNLKRILQIISDYLSWNDEMIEESLNGPKPEPANPAMKMPDEPDEEEPKGFVRKALKKIGGFFGKVGGFVKKLFKRKKEDLPLPETPEKPECEYMMIYGKPHKWVDGKWVRCTKKEFNEMMRAYKKAKKEHQQAEKEAAAAERERAAAEEAEGEQSTETAESAESAEATEPAAEESTGKKSWWKRRREEKAKKKQAAESETAEPAAEAVEEAVTDEADAADGIEEIESDVDATDEVADDEIDASDEAEESAEYAEDDASEAEIDETQDEGEVSDDE